MAYGLKYYNTSYNRFGTAVRVELYQDGGSGSSQIQIQSVQIATNFQDLNTPVIGTGAKIVVINSGSFSYFNTLLTNYEKQWMCKILYNSEVVFEGYLICDINEQELLPNAAITLQFANYLRRLEDNYLTILNDIGERKSMWQIIKAALDVIDFTFETYINSTMFEQNMVESSTTTLLEQIYLECDLFYTSPELYENTYMVLNKILKSFNMFLYMFGDKWVLERYNDISRAGNWVKVTTGGAFQDAGSSLKKQYAAGTDFKYVNQSQVLQYDSGVKTLKLSLLDKPFDSLVFNNYMQVLVGGINEFTILTGSRGVWDADDQPLTGEIPVERHWYMHTDMLSIVKGSNYRGVSQYFTFDADTDANNEWHGVYYKFPMNRNMSTVDGLRQKTNINFSWKVLLPDNYKDYSEIRTRMSLGFKGVFYMYGTYFNIDGILYYGVDNKWAVNRLPLGDVYPVVNTKIYKTVDNDTGVIEESFSINVDEIQIQYSGSPSFEYVKVTDQDLLSEILELSIIFLPNIADGDTLQQTSYGDIQVTVTEETIDNDLTNEVNQNFVKTEEIELNVFDIDSINYVNTPLLDTGSSGDVFEGFIPSSGWRDGGSGGYTKSIVDLFIEGKMGKWAQTSRKLVATISCNIFLKLFSIFTDTNIGSNKFVLTQYTWDLINGTYEIEADEYPDTDIVISKV